MARERTDTQSVINLVINGQQADTTLRQLSDSQRRLNTEMRNMRPNDPGFRERLRELNMINAALREQQNEMRGIATQSSTLRQNFSGIAAGVAGGLGLSAGLSILSGAIGKIKDAYAEAEKNRAILTNAFQGDAKMANESLKMLMDYAAKTPFGLQEATDGYLKLVNRGVIPTREEMVKLGDVAASQGKSLDQYIEAIMDAQTGENERLKELGIRAQKNGDTVAFTFKGITKEVKNTEDAIYDALISFGEMNGVAGTMETVSKTVVGLQSNIEDSWDQIFTKLGQGSEGVIQSFYQTYSSILGFINDDLMSTQTNAEKLAIQFKQQTEEVKNLEKQLIPLSDRYDELKGKTQLNTAEQTELKSIIDQIHKVMPYAINDWDKLGNAIGISTEKIRGTIREMKAANAILNKSAIEENEAQLRDYQGRVAMYIRQLRQGTKVKTDSRGLFSELVPLTNEDRAKLQKQLEEAQEHVLGYSKILKDLRGQFEDPKTEIAAPISTARTEGVIKKEIDALKELKKEQDIHSKSYAEYTQKIKKLEEELANAGGKKSSAQTKAESAVKKLEKEHDKLKELAIKMAAEFEIKDTTGLEKKMLEIEKKYDPIIAKAREFKNEVLAASFETTKGKEMTFAEDEMKKKATEDIAKSNQKALSDGKDYLDQSFKGDKRLLDGQLATDLAGADTEAAQLTLKADAMQKERELTEAHLLATKLLYETYGADATEIDTELTNIRLQNAEREATGKLAYTEAKKQIDAAYLESAQEATGFLKGLVGQQTLAYKGLIIADKALAMAKVAINTQAEISGYYARYALVPGGTVIASGLAAAARVRSGISMGIIGATGIVELVKSFGGEKSDSGDAHAGGVRNAPAGTALVGEKGNELIEADGKWWITDGPQLADLPNGANVYNASETSRMIKNKSLGEQLYPRSNYTIEENTIREAERNYRSNTTQVSKASSVQNYSSEANLAMKFSTKEMEEKMDEMIQAIKTGLIFDYMKFEDFKAKIDTSRNSQSG